MMLLEKTFGIASTPLTLISKFFWHDGKAINEEGVMKKTDLVLWKWRGDEVRSRREEEMMRVWWRKRSTERSNDEDKNWNKRMSRRNIAKATDWTGDATQRKKKWKYELTLKYDSPHRWWRYEWSEAKVKLNDIRPIVEEDDERMYRSPCVCRWCLCWYAIVAEAGGD